MKRSTHVLTELLNVLADWTEPVDEAVIHAQLNMAMAQQPTLAEFRHAITTAHGQGWIDKTDSIRRGDLWFITNKGKAERLS